MGIIRHELPTKNRYVNLKNIKTRCFEQIDKLTKKQITTLIQLNYFRNNEKKFYPKQENIDPYFIGHNSKTFWSYFVEEDLLIDNKNMLNYNMKNAFITGFAGMVGSHLTDYLLENTDWNIYGFCRWNESLENIEHLSPLINKKDRVQIIYGDLNDLSSLMTAIDKSKPDFVFH